MTPPSTTAQRLHGAQQSLEAGAFADAERTLREILRAEPGNVAALHLLGVAIAQSGRPAEGYKLIERSIRLSPSNNAFRRNFAVLLTTSHQPSDARRAIDVVREALTISPLDEELRGLLVKAMERAQLPHSRGIDWLAACLPAPTDDANAWLTRAIALGRIGDGVASVAAYERVLALDPGHAEAAQRLALCLVDLRVPSSRLVEVIRRALALNPDGPQSDKLRAALGSQLVEAGEVADGEAILRDLVRAGGDAPDPTHLRNLAAALQLSARADEAATLFARAVELDPHNAAGAMQGLLNALYLHPDDPPALLAMHRAFKARFVASITPLPPRPMTSAVGRRLRVGFVSGDFRGTSVGYFLLGLIEALARRRRVEVHCFTTVGVVDDWTRRFRAAADGWHPVFDLGDDGLAQRVRESEIDVLIDLAGYTAGTRLLAFARRPAPLQMSYLGYPFSTGLSCIDCRITDAVADPPGASEGWHTERLLRLPRTFGLIRPVPGAPPVSPSPALARGYVTFGSVSLAAKVNDTVIATWAAALLAAPASTRLLLINAAYADAATRERIANRFKLHGIDARQRIEFIGRLPFADYLRAHARIDLMLDTFPFNGHTTTVQNLWMGVPVLTIAGIGHRARMGTSVLTAIGLPQLIARDQADFVKKAAHLANNPQRLADFRGSLRERMRQSPSIDEDGFARDFEELLLAEWERRLGEPPESHSPSA